MIDFLHYRLTRVCSLLFHAGHEATWSYIKLHEACLSLFAGNSCLEWVLVRATRVNHTIYPAGKSKSPVRSTIEKHFYTTCLSVIWFNRNLNWLHVNYLLPFEILKILMSPTKYLVSAFSEDQMCVKKIWCMRLVDITKALLSPLSVCSHLLWPVADSTKLFMILFTGKEKTTGSC